MSAEGAQLLGGTVDLDPFTQRTGEILASSLYGRRTAVGHGRRRGHRPPRAGARPLAGDRPRDQPGSGCGCAATGRRSSPWEECRELFEPGPLAEQLTSLREMAPADLASAFEALPQARRSQLAAALDDEELADLLEEMPEQDQIRLLDSLDEHRAQRRRRRGDAAGRRRRPARRDAARAAGAAAHRDAVGAGGRPAPPAPLRQGHRRRPDDLAAAGLRARRAGRRGPRPGQGPRPARHDGRAGLRVRAADC